MSGQQQPSSGHSLPGTEKLIDASIDCLRITRHMKKALNKPYKFIIKEEYRSMPLLGGEDLDHIAKYSVVIIDNNLEDRNN